MEKIRLELEAKFLGTKKAEEAQAAAEGGTPQQPGQPGQQRPPEEQFEQLVALN